LKVLCIFGTRPEAIKMAPVVRELRKYSGRIESRVCVTAQHRQMLDQVLQLFDIAPDFDLDIMKDNQPLSQITTSVLIRLEPFLLREKPDWVLVQGDTTTTMATALLAFYHRIRIGHVEAGLRTWDRHHPFPEEVNRRITDALSDLHFAPTQAAKQNLVQEGINEESVFVTGNTVIDALLEVLQKPYSWIWSDVPQDKRLILVTAHRRENFGEPLVNICHALLDIASRYSGDVHLVCPIHLNPNVQKLMYSLLNGVENITLIPPLEYMPFVHLMNQAYLILTDSGGIQEEAPSLGKPVLVLREVTERPEAVEAGAVKVVGTSRSRIVEETVRLLEDEAEYQRMAHATNPYGDGHAAERIVAALLRENRHDSDL